MLVIGDCRKEVWPRHRDLDRLACVSRHVLELIDEAEIDVIGYWSVANSCRMRDIWDRIS